MTLPSISIIVPVFNTEKYLERCILSILAQTFTDYELILVNDGSTDTSRSICDKYCQVDQRIQVIHKSNRGLSSARNAGLAIAKGKYIGFVDSDDCIAPDQYSHLYQASILHKADIVMGGYLKIPHHSKPFTFPQNTSCPQNTILNDKDLLEHCILPFFGYVTTNRIPEAFSSSCDKLYRREFIKDNSFLSEREYISEDNLFNLSLYIQKPAFVFSPNYGYHYFENSASLTSRYSTKHFCGFLKYFAMLLEFNKYIESTIDIQSLIATQGYLRFTSLYLTENPLFTYKILKSTLSSKSFKKIIEKCSNRSMLFENILLIAYKKEYVFIAWLIISAYWIFKMVTPKHIYKPSYQN